MRKLIIIIFISLSSLVKSQVWDTLRCGTSGYVTSIYGLNDSLYVGGNFAGPCSVSCIGIGKWNGINWDSVGSGLLGQANAFMFYNNEFYVGGSFWNAGGLPNTKMIAKWNGSQYQSVYTGTTTGNYIHCMCVYNGDLYVGGKFSMIGGVAVNDIAKFNGTNWSSMSGGLGGFIPEAFSMTVFNNELYVAGAFDLVGGIPAHNIARWNGTQWDSVGTGLDDVAQSITYQSLFNKLFVGGGFTTAGGIPAKGVAVWDGSNWASTGYDFDCNVLSLCVYHDEVYAGGCFQKIGNDSITALAKWDFIHWDTVGIGATVFNNTVDALHVWKDTLYAGGYMDSIGNLKVNHIAKFYSPPIPNVGIGEDIKKNGKLLCRPNPFSDFTEIDYQLPEGTSHAELKIFDVTGKLVKTYSLTESSGTIQFSAKDLSPGLYSAMLFSDKMTLRMVKLMITRN